MNKDLFALVPNTFEPSLIENYEGIETFLNLEYQGMLTAEIKNSLADKNKVTAIPKLLTSIAMATVLLLAACTPGSSGDKQEPLPYKEEILGPYKHIQASITVTKKGINKYLIEITSSGEAGDQRPHNVGDTIGELHQISSSYKKLEDGSSVYTELVELRKAPLMSEMHAYQIGYGPEAAHLLFNLTPDLVINGITQLSSLYAIGHIEVDQLIFEDWARLQTGGEDLEITANTIIAKSGLITANDLGGHVKLSARNLYGNLNIEASGTVSHPGTLDVVIENMDWLPYQGYGCGIGGRYNTEGKGHTSSMVIKNNHCWKN